MPEDAKKLFQITEAARACSLSRSTLLRLEEKGLLTPAYTAPDSGRRYYDNHNVARILQIEKLKAMGLGTEDIAAYFASGGETAVLLAALEEHLHEVARGVEELRLRAGTDTGISVQVLTLPAVTCCRRLCEGHTIAEKYNAMYDFYGECVRRGYRLSDEPIFTVSQRRDFLNGYITVSVLGVRARAPRKSPQGGRDSAGLPRPVGAVLRQLRGRGRGVFASGPRGEGTRSDTRRGPACAGHCCALHRARNRNQTVLLPPGAAGGGRSRTVFPA